MFEFYACCFLLYQCRFITTSTEVLTQVNESEMNFGAGGGTELCIISILKIFTNHTLRSLQSAS